MENFEKMEVGERLQYMIELKGVTKVGLAATCGITQAAISNITTQLTRRPSAETLLKLAGALQVSPEWLMTGTGDPHQTNTLGARSEQELIELFRKLSDDAKASIISMIRALSRK